MSVTEIRCDWDCQEKSEDRHPGYASRACLSQIRGRDIRGTDRNGCGRKGKAVHSFIEARKEYLRKELSSRVIEQKEMRRHGPGSATCQLRFF